MYNIILQASGIQSLKLVSGNIADYVPYVQGLCFALAALCAVFFAYLMYEDMIHDRGRLQQKMLMCIGSVLTFIGLAVYTPAFFGLDKSASGSFATDAKFGITGVTKGGLMTRDNGNGSISTGMLITDIPSLDSPVWQEKFEFTDSRYDKSEETFLMYAELYSYANGDRGNLNKMLQILYQQGQINQSQFLAMMSYNVRNYQKGNNRQ